MGNCPGGACRVKYRPLSASGGADDDHGHDPEGACCDACARGETCEGETCAKGEVIESIVDLPPAPSEAMQMGVPSSPFARRVEALRRPVLVASPVIEFEAEEPTRLRYERREVIAPSNGVANPFTKRSAGLGRSGVARSGYIMPPQWNVNAGMSQADRDAAWAAIDSTTQLQIIQGFQTAGSGGGGGSGGGATASAGSLALPADMRSLYTAGQWAALDDDSRREAIRVAHLPSAAQEVFTGLLAAANLSLTTWLTMDQRDRDQRQRELQMGADERQRQLLADIQRAGGTTTPQQQAMLDAIQQSIVGMNTARQQGVSNTAMLIGGTVVVLAVVGIGAAVVLSRPRRNPSGGREWKLPTLGGVSTSRREKRREQRGAR